MSAPLLDTLNAMNLDEFSAYIDSLIKRTMDGGMLSREETTALLDLEPDSPKAVIMEQKAGAMAKTVTNGTGRIWSAVGVDRHPCTMNCKFCSLGKQWGLIKDTAEWPVEDIREAARLAGEHHASWFVLRTTEFYSLERLTKLASDIRAILPESCQLVVNTGELTHETADKLVNAGVCGVYDLFFSSSSWTSFNRDTDRKITMVLPCFARDVMLSRSGTGVRPAIRVRITVWLTSGRVYSARSAAAAPQKELTPGQTS